MNEFEQKLSRQPMRQIPAGWREEILAAAEVIDPRRNEANSTVNPISWWRELFWPHPKAWAGLAAVWVFIFVLNFSTRDKTPVLAEKVSPPSPEVLAELKQQQRLLAELMGPTTMSDAERPKFVPKPRSECVEISAA